MTTAAQRLAAKRRAIHAACRQLGMDEETRRAMMVDKAKVSSTKDLDMAGADRILDHLKKSGAALGKKNVGQHPGKPHNFNSQPYLWRIEQLLADMRLPWSYADKIAENITGGKKPGAVQKLAWVKKEEHFRGIIAALDVEHRKRSLLEWIDECLKKLGKTHDDVDALLKDRRPGYTGNWKRDIKMLGSIGQFYHEQLMEAGLA